MTDDPMTTASPRTRRCPQCRESFTLAAAENPWRPFCSRRCKLLDLGEWLDEFGTRDDDAETSSDSGPRHPLS